MSTLSLGLVLFSLMLITSETSALKCWRCASDTVNSEFCQERLDLSLLTPQQRNWYYIECSPPAAPKNIYGQTMVSRCRMQIQTIQGRKVYSRACVAEAEDAERNACLARSVFQEVRVDACETCQEDGCNAFLSEKPAEKRVEDSNSPAIKASYSTKLLSIVFGFAWLLF